jgi:putative membrane protein insertion efficiency factor
MSKLFQIIVLCLIRIYRLFLSPLLPRACRFYPTCSQYAEEAVRRFGPVRGGALAVSRLSRCHPFHRGGYDPLPAGEEGP